MRILGVRPRPIEESCMLRWLISNTQNRMLQAVTHHLTLVRAMVEVDFDEHAPPGGIRENLMVNDGQRWR